MQISARAALPAEAESGERADHGDRGFVKLDYQLHDYPGPVKTALFGIQHVLVMFTAMVGGPLIVARLLNLTDESRIVMVSGTMIGCGIATMISSLGLGFVGPRLPIVMGVFYIFIGPIVAIAKDVSLAAAMTALMIGGLVQFAWSPLIGRLHRFFPPVVTGTTILLIGTGLMKIGISVATGFGTPAFAKPLTLSLAALMIVLIILINRFAKGFVKALSLFLTMVIGYLVAAAFGLITADTVQKASWVAVPSVFPYGNLEWPGIIGVVTVIICFFATAVETTGHTLACSRICGVPQEGWRIRGAVANDGIGSTISALFGGMALTSYSQNIGVISLTGVGSRFVVAFGGAFLIIMAMVPKVGAIIALMPNAVLGGVLLFMFGMVASVGIDIIGRNMTSRRDALILAASLGVGLGIQAAPPGAFDAISPALRILVADGIVMGILLAMLLNIVMPKEQ
jgi:NCS2 family nucleobase:cation symporter-2